MLRTGLAYVVGKNSHAPLNTIVYITRLNESDLTVEGFFTDDFGTHICTWDMIELENIECIQL